MWQGQSVAKASRSIAVTAVMYDRWRQEFGGLKSIQIKRLKDLETENTRLRWTLADFTLDKLILEEAASGIVAASRVGASVSSMRDGSLPFPSAESTRR